MVGAAVALCVEYSSSIGCPQMNAGGGATPTRELAWWSWVAGRHMRKDANKPWLAVVRSLEASLCSSPLTYCSVSMRHDW